MKLIKKLRKGFTLIELVVVIAVIAILSAVSVVSYIAITNKAKRSSDEQAVSQMNTVLAANSVMDLRSIRDVFAAFEENGLDAENYKPLSKDTYFFWDQDENKIVYVDKEYKVIFPESLKGKTKEQLGHSWLSLSGEIKKTDYAGDKSGSNVSISGNATQAGEKLYKLSEDVKSGAYNTNTTEEKVITLPEKVDLAGAEFNLGTANNLTVQGASETNKTEFENVLTTESQQKGSAQHAQRQYAAGMVQKVAGDVTFKNLKIKNVSIGDYGVSMAAIFAGRIDSGTLTIENCEIEDAYIYGEQKVAAFVAHVNGGNVVIKNCTLKNVHIYAEEGVAGGVFGYKKNATISVKCDSSTATSIQNNVTSELTKVADRHYYKVPTSDLPANFADASNEVVSTFNSYTNRTPETINGKERCKPGCATFGWVATSELYPEGQSYMVSYGMNPIHAGDML